MTSPHASSSTLLVQRQHQPHLQPSPKPDSWPAEANRKLELVVKAGLEKSVRYEQQIRSLETKLSGELNSTRLIREDIAEVLGGLASNRERVDTSLNREMPQLVKQLDRTMTQLRQLEEKLPEIHSQVETIRSVYDSGRETARDLTADLEWRQSSISDKGRRILLTRTAPISSFEIAIIRTIVYISFLIFAWRFGVALEGAYRAYRHRLVWGDKLMS